MIKYTILLNKVHRLLDKEDWPKKLVLEPKTFWDLIVALDGQLDDVDWHFEEESEGFPYIVLGPTMICPVRFGRKNELKVEGSMEQILSATEELKFIDKWEKNDTKEGETDERQESEGIEAISVREAERVDEGRVLPETPTAPTVHGDEDVPDDGPKADPDGSGWKHVGTNYGPPRG